MARISILKSKIKKYIDGWKKMGYENGLPDEGDLVLESFNLIPSYRLVCIAIMKNDLQLKTLGMNKPKCETYNQIKRSELIQKGKIKENPQQRLKL